MSSESIKKSVAPEKLSWQLAEDMRRRMAGPLGEELMREVEWVHGDPNFEHVQSNYYEAWKELSGGHKKYSYFELYDRLFGPFRNTSARMLEIGVYQGASINTWKSFLGEGSVVVGIDINPNCSAFDDPTAQTHVRIGSQADPSFLREIASEFGPFDIVLDDGSHMTDHQIVSFQTLFASHVAPGGIYFVEDTNTSCWPHYRRGEQDIFDLILAGGLALHSFYSEHHYSDYARPAHPRTFRTLAGAKLIEEMRVLDSGVAFYKARENYHPPLVDHR